MKTCTKHVQLSYKSRCLSDCFTRIGLVLSLFRRVFTAKCTRFDAHPLDGLNTPPSHPGGGPGRSRPNRQKPRGGPDLGRRG